MACRSGSVSYIMASFNLPCCISISRFSPPLTFIPHKEISSTLFCGRKLASSSNHHFARRSCGKSDISEQYQYPPPQDALLLKAIAEVSKREGRVGEATVVVFDSSSGSGWLALDRKLHCYPRKRGFTAIGTGGDDFVKAMVYAVESVVQHPIPQGQVRKKISTHGKYVSVKIGPLQVASSEQVQAVYYAMTSDERIKYFF